MLKTKRKKWLFLSESQPWWSMVFNMVLKKNVYQNKLIYLINGFEVFGGLV